MTSIIKFTPLCGAYSEDPLCYLLEIDEYRILLDCGWNTDFDVELLKPLKRVVGKINAVLISHPDLEHLGALPYAVGKLGMKAQIFGTIPVHKMGQMFMYDVYQSRKNSEDFDTFNLDDVDDAFDNFTQLKYSQRYFLTGKGIRLEITPYSAGHMIGGTVWQIKRETDEIIYAVDYNHKKERHLSPSVLETLNQPTLLITDAFNAQVEQEPRRNRDKELFDSLIATLRNNGNVLLPVDSAGRVLELLLILEQHWNNFHHSYPIIFLTNVSYNTVEFAKMTLEWMSDSIMKKFISNRENSFQFSSIKLCHKVSEVHDIKGPKVVLASLPDLTSGLAQQLFIDWCNDSKNKVLFTDRGRANTLGRKLMKTKPGKITIQRWTRIPLSGEELAEFERQRQLEKEAEEQKKIEEEEIQRKRREQIEMYDYEGEDADITASLSSMWHKHKGHDLYPELIKREFLIQKATQNLGSDQSDNLSLKDVEFGDKSLPFPMFPCIEKNAIYDEYGECIRPEDFIRAAEMAAGSDENPFNNEEKTETKEMEVEQVKEVPTKSIFEKLDMVVNCTIQYIGSTNSWDHYLYTLTYNTTT
eukprot:TRINITY_DN4916_c0_g1_i1.p1 TRINITY_DN4916_c0_g1~~TRINITY_DN4916_c0_g1_i1.p1  ORF type:complete len:585 (+),score=119.09 TRINITY_DN4916_c0_g1_i1:17-1771(+)